MTQQTGGLLGRVLGAGLCVIPQKPVQSIKDSEGKKAKLASEVLEKEMQRGDGEIQKHLQEGVKHDDGKLRYDLLPVKPLEAIVYVFTMGAAKYADRNWEKGLRWGRVFAAMMRHAWAWWRGERYDKKDGQHHLASVAWCAMALMEFEDTHPELDDRCDTGRNVHGWPCVRPSRTVISERWSRVSRDCQDSKSVRESDCE